MTTEERLEKMERELAAASTEYLLNARKVLLAREDVRVPA